MRRAIARGAYGGKSALRDKPLCNFDSSAIELVRAVRRLFKKHDGSVLDDTEERVIVTQLAR